MSTQHNDIITKSNHSQVQLCQGQFNAGQRESGENHASAQYETTGPKVNSLLRSNI